LLSDYVFSYPTHSLQEMAKILQHPRVYSFLHVPVQSGSDGILGLMKREYSQADFCHVVDFLRQRVWWMGIAKLYTSYVFYQVPDITIATDIICGFPTESEQDFEDTYQLCVKYRFPTLFINQVGEG